MFTSRASRRERKSRSHAGQILRKSSTFIRQPPNLIYTTDDFNKMRNILQQKGMIPSPGPEPEPTPDNQLVTGRKDITIPVGSSLSYNNRALISSNYLNFLETLQSEGYRYATTTITYVIENSFATSCIPLLALNHFYYYYNGSQTSEKDI